MLWQLYLILVFVQGSLENGKVFDSSLERDPFPVKLGEGQVIKGKLTVVHK